MNSALGLCPYVRINSPVYWNLLTAIESQSETVIENMTITPSITATTTPAIAKLTGKLWDCVTSGTVFLFLILSTPARWPAHSHARRCSLTPYKHCLSIQILAASTVLPILEHFSLV